MGSTITQRPGVLATEKSTGKMCHVSCVMSYVSCVMCLIYRVNNYLETRHLGNREVNRSDVLCVMYHESCVMCLVSCVNPLIYRVYYYSETRSPGEKSKGEISRVGMVDWMFYQMV